MVTSFSNTFTVTLNRFKPSSKIFYWPFQGGTSFVDLLCFCSVLCLLCFVHVCLYVLCGHLLGKSWPLGSRLWCLLRVCHFPIGILGQVWYLIVSIPDLCTITYFYSGVLREQLWRAIRDKRSELYRSGFILHQDNAPVHVSRVVKNHFNTHRTVQIWLSVTSFCFIPKRSPSWKEIRVQRGTRYCNNGGASNGNTCSTRSARGWKYGTSSFKRRGLTLKRNELYL